MPTTATMKSSVVFYIESCEEYSHSRRLQTLLLEKCILCEKRLGPNNDIFVYRGDTPFCSDECRQEQIEMDEAKERSWNLSASFRALRKQVDQPKKSVNCPRTVRSETVLVA